MSFAPLIYLQDFIEGVLGIHLASYVEGPLNDRGGLMLVSGPGQLKTTILDVLEDNFESVRSMSNSYMETMKRMQPAFYNGQIRSLCFPDLQSIYAGDPRTAGRIEQMIMQLAAEATRTIGGDQDPAFAKFESRCTIFAGMQAQLRSKHATRWEDSGFNRRFLWSSYVLNDPGLLTRAIIHWQRAELGNFRIPKIPLNLRIKDVLQPVHREQISHWVRHQPGPHEIQILLLCKATSALHWHYQTSNIKRNALNTMREFAKSLQDKAALIELPEQDFDKQKPQKIPKMRVPKTNGEFEQQQNATK